MTAQGAPAVNSAARRPAAPAPLPHPGARRRRRRRNLTAYLYIAPAMVLFLVFALGPFLHAVWLSFFDWDGITIGTWTGLGNYRAVLTDPMIREAFGHSLVLIAMFATIPVAIGLAIATIMTTVRVRGSTAFRVAIFLPQVVSSVVVGVIWNWLYAPDGPINELLRSVGLGSLARPWLGDFTWSLPSIGLIGAWMLMGLCMVLFVAGIQQIDGNLYDAVRVDGGGRWRELLTVTIPSLRYEFGVVLTLTIVGALRTFDLVFVMTRGGPGTETTVPGLLLYNRAFVDGRVGQACAIAVILAILVFAITVTIDRVAAKES
ncbi:carbohydrate ABC transporter permease [Asanoa iriomotensis]|uniref:ABC transporter permease n=1 Tax=Asanoa iriomotensis TaxID=234613 RepID=A0ABQ4BZ27_9ACTN|nr:sugar ABC transporter permease [Asanoa iriomotensis]GIF55767.1 ABC transporter permease [Asanoa iriomotensis]